MEQNNNVIPDIGSISFGSGYQSQNNQNDHSNKQKLHINLGGNQKKLWIVGIVVIVLLLIILCAVSGEKRHAIKAAKVVFSGDGEKYIDCFPKEIRDGIADRDSTENLSESIEELQEENIDILSASKITDKDFLEWARNETIDPLCDWLGIESDDLKVKKAYIVNVKVDDGDGNYASVLVLKVNNKWNVYTFSYMTWY